MSVLIRARVSGSHRRSSMASLPPSWAQGGMIARRSFWPGVVGIDVGPDVESLPSSLLDHGDDLGHPAPELLLGDLQVDHVHPHRRPTRRRRSPPRSSEDPVPLVADVGGVETAVARRHRGQLDELGGGHQARGRHQERRREAESPLLHRPGDLALHGRHLLVGGRLERVALDEGPHLGLADVGADVEATPLRLDVAEVAPEGRPLLLARRDRTRRAALAEDHGGDPLSEHALAAGLLQEGVVGVVVDVDEPRGHHQPGGVDRPPRGGLGEVADPHDPAIPKADVGLEALGP